MIQNAHQWRTRRKSAEPATRKTAAACPHSVRRVGFLSETLMSRREQSNKHASQSRMHTSFEHHHPSQNADNGHGKPWHFAHTHQEIPYDSAYGDADEPVPCVHRREEHRDQNNGQQIVTVASVIRNARIEPGSALANKASTAKENAISVAVGTAQP